MYYFSDDLICQLVESIRKAWICLLDQIRAARSSIEPSQWRGMVAQHPKLSHFPPPDRIYEEGRNGASGLTALLAPLVWLQSLEDVKLNKPLSYISGFTVGFCVVKLIDKHGKRQAKIIHSDGFNFKE